MKNELLFCAYGTAGDFFSGVTRWLCAEVVRAKVDNNRSADDFPHSEAAGFDCH